MGLEEWVESERLIARAVLGDNRSLPGHKDETRKPQTNLEKMREKSSAVYFFLFSFLPAELMGCGNGGSIPNQVNPSSWSRAATASTHVNFASPFFFFFPFTARRWCAERERESHEVVVSRSERSANI